jgi:DNA-binding CsgD family transcriptional regulator
MKSQTVQIDPKLQSLFDQMPGCWGCKDKDSVFMYANKEYAKIIGVKESRHLDIIGRTDFDMPCDTVNCAELFRKQDNTVIVSEKRMRILDIHPFSGKEWKAYIFTKTPLYDDHKNITGTIFHGAEITNSTTLELGSFLSKMTSDIQNDLLGSQNSFLLTNKLNEIKLSNREAECLFFILRGKTVKLIARFLGISPRTVEEHVANLKRKFTSQNKHELIDKAIQAGFLNTIPEGLFQTQLSVALKEE